MSSKLDPLVVAQRLEVLRQLYVPETSEECQARLEREQPPRKRVTSADPEFAKLVAQRLEELRALCELTRYLHAARQPEGVGASK